MANVKWTNLWWSSTRQRYREQAPALIDKLMTPRNPTTSLLRVFSDKTNILEISAFTTAMVPLTPKFGVYTPLVTFFTEDESLDIESTLTHAKRMAEGDVAGLVLQGSNGEAPHLDHEERKYLVRAVRDHLNELGYVQIQLIVGCGAPSVRETLAHITEAKESGADFALVLPPSYWVLAMSTDVIEGFFDDVFPLVSSHFRLLI